VTTYYNDLPCKTAYGVNHLCIDYNGADMKILPEFLLYKKGCTKTIQLRERTM